MVIEDKYDYWKESSTNKERISLFCYYSNFRDLTSTRILQNRYLKESILKMVLTYTGIKAMRKSDCNALQQLWFVYMHNTFIIQSWKEFCLNSISVSLLSMKIIDICSINSFKKIKVVEVSNISEKIVLRYYK